MKKKMKLVFFMAVTTVLLLNPIEVLEVEAEEVVSGAGATETQTGFVEGKALPATYTPPVYEGEKPEGRLPSTGEIVASSAAGMGLAVLLFASLKYIKNSKKKRG